MADTLGDPVLAAITERAAKADAANADATMGSSERYFHARNSADDVSGLLARVGELEALVAAKDQVTQRLIREHNEELRIAKDEPERRPRERRYPERDFGDEDRLEDQ